MKRLTNDDLVSIGFVKVETFNVGNIHNYDLGRDRCISAMCIGQGNEAIFICQKEDKEVSDLVCIHNCDYDGFITLERLQALIKWFDKDGVTISLGAKLDPLDVVTDSYRPPNAGLNVANVGVRMAHTKTGIVVECHSERSQLRNRNKAYEQLEQKVNETYKIKGKLA